MKGEKWVGCIGVNRGMAERDFRRGNSFRLRSVEGDLTNPPPSGREAFGRRNGVSAGCNLRILPQSLTRQLPPGGSLSYCAQCPAKEPIVPLAAESRNRAKPHRPAKESTSNDTPPRGPCGEYDSGQGRDWGSGGSPEGVAVLGQKSDTPSGPLCFFLGSEKEEPSRVPAYNGFAVILPLHSVC